MVKKIFLAVTVFAILLAALFFGGSHILAQSQPKPQLAQEEDIDYAYPEEDIPDPIDYPETPLIEQGDNLQSTFEAIGAANQELQNKMDDCYQNKQQRYNELLAQNRQFEELEKERDALDAKIADLDYGDEQLPALEDEREQVQETINELDNTIYDNKEALDDEISRCNEAISELQTKIDDLEDALNTRYDALVEYELPY